MEGLTVRRDVRRGAGQLDAALTELGMLATVTDARREYLQETLNAREKANSSNIHHHGIQQQDTWNPLSQEKMLRKIIRDEKRKLLKDQHYLPQDQQVATTTQQKLPSITLGDYRGWDADQTVPLLSLARKEIHDFPQRVYRSASTSRTRHLFMPYDRGSCQLQHRPLTLYSMHSPKSDQPVVQQHLTNNFVHRATGGHCLRPSVTVPSSCSSLSQILHLPGQLQQNKSNPPSPVKSYPLLVGVEGTAGPPLVRSKSLDNIALCPLAATITEDPSFQLTSDAFSSAGTSPRISRVDTIVESVSSRISSLQLTAN